MLILPPLKEKRMAHCVSVAKLGYDLALAHGCDAMSAYLCGVFHDIARELPPEQMLEEAEKRDILIGEEERRSPLLLHGDLSAAVMAENYGIADEAMLNAVRRHTVGNETMTLLDKIIFIADKVEPLRSYEGIEALRALAFTDLDRALFRAVEEELIFGEKHGYCPHPKTLALKNRLIKEGEKPQ